MIAHANILNMGYPFSPYSLRFFSYSKYDTHNLLRIGDEGGESEDMMLASDIEPDKTISAPAAGVSNVSVSWP